MGTEMTAVTETAPGLSLLVSGGSPDLQHITCCDDDLAMCGQDVTGHVWASDEEAERFCPMCFLVEEEGLPCPAPGCPAGEQR